MSEDNRKIKNERRLIWCAFFLIVVLASVGIIVYCYRGKNSDTAFRVNCLNDDKKIYTDTTGYFYVDPDAAEIYRYDFQTRETERFIC